jgi:hypothetical protein
MGVHGDAMPDDPTLQAVMYGPLVLAGRLGAEPTRAGPTPPRMTPDFDDPKNPITMPIAVAPIRVASGDITSVVKQVSRKPLRFKIVGQEKEILLAPFNAMYDERYAVYWKVVSG